ncbi:hypothetical protein HII31_06914 [Pseudocercospora fuligena]|uniref:Uncharacterized protein n=1 Tax=Pseudocercospora fuligena TaxID=685502 RepID=A0A8H6RIZ2_9PEZI|nr:hypothetical protein HII31_06914 [Pseudocercospora fuligena]
MGLLGISKDKLTRKSHARKASRAESPGKARSMGSVSKAEQGLTSSAPTTGVQMSSEGNHESASERHVECLAVTQDAGHTPMPSPTSNSSASKPKIVMSGRPASAGYFHSSHIPEDRDAWPHSATRSYDDRTAA